MVRHHLLLPHTATRRDLEDPATVTRVAKTLDGNPLLLDLLEALAEADSLATGPGVWSPWKRTLISDLARRCRALLAGEPLPAPSAPSADALELAAAVAADGRPQIQLDPDADPPSALVAMPDQVGSLAAAAGVLALHSLEVHAAELNTVDGVALFTFTVSPRFGGLPDPALLRSELGRVLDGTLELDEALRRKERDYAPMTADRRPVAAAAGALVRRRGDRRDGRRAARHRPDRPAAPGGRGAGGVPGGPALGPGRHARGARSSTRSGWPAPERGRPPRPGGPAPDRAGDAGGRPLNADRRRVLGSTGPDAERNGRSRTFCPA